jgi:glucokinase
VVAAAGTGFGLAVLDWDGREHHPRATEAGHAGYAARTPREIALLRHLQRRHGRVSIERVVSGPGLAAIHDFLRAEAGAPEPPELRAAVDRSQAIAQAAAAHRDPICQEALDIFCESYGAAVGDAALAYLATGGVWIGGAIAASLLPSLRAGGFLAAFLDKGRFRALLESVPVSVCMATDTALAGACRLAARDAKLE